MKRFITTYDLYFWLCVLSLVFFINTDDRAEFLVLSPAFVSDAPEVRDCRRITEVRARITGKYYDAGKPFLSVTSSQISELLKVPVPLFASVENGQEITMEEGLCTVYLLKVFPATVKYKVVIQN